MVEEINEIEYSSWVVSKVSGPHRLTMDDVFDAVENFEKMSWEYDDEHGRRLLVRGKTASGRVVRVFLYPVDGSPGTFRLGTAF